MIGKLIGRYRVVEKLGEGGMGVVYRAFEWLGKAVEERSSLLVWLKVDPAFDPIRGDRRFLKLLAAVGLD